MKAVFFILATLLSSDVFAVNMQKLRHLDQASQAYLNTLSHVTPEQMETIKKMNRQSICRWYQIHNQAHELKKARKSIERVNSECHPIETAFASKN
ncbi:hypothetical protein HR060_11930 [Catenovulum sp. SM1970]|uniref:hypothetical protein n=1 Tax=Marinifaba aquimaris TaxID=2741323 RepID=UPI0015743F33|nr:hypothetical protein [Marinifaba aquimaris]NTS77573.1 hypothetical protein [Marinifaba aquimaris]